MGQRYTLIKARCVWRGDDTTYVECECISAWKHWTGNLTHTAGSSVVDGIHISLVSFFARCLLGVKVVAL
jgi:hypothetical protein